MLLKHKVKIHLFLVSYLVATAVAQVAPVTDRTLQELSSGCDGGILCDETTENVEIEEKVRVTKVENTLSLSGQFEFKFGKSCCTVSQTPFSSPDDECKDLGAFIARADRTHRTDIAICDLPPRTLNNGVELPGGDFFCSLENSTLSMQLRVEFEFEPQDCCVHCRCFGDPICQSFLHDTEYTDKTHRENDFDTWILCDGREALPIEERKSCVITEERCSKQTDYHGNKCIFDPRAPVDGRKYGLNSDGEKAERWDVLCEGSPCQPAKDSRNPLSMFAIENRFNFTVFQGDRGYINEIEIKTFPRLKSTFRLTAEDCVLNKTWTLEGEAAGGEGSDVVSFHRHKYDKIQGNRWSFFDKSSGVTGDVTCYANKVKGSEVSVARFNVEHLNDLYWNKKQFITEGYCTNRKFITGGASLPYNKELDMECEREERENKGLIRNYFFREICRDDILPPEFPECVCDFCDSNIPDANHDKLKTFCKDKMSDSNPNNWALKSSRMPNRNSYVAGFCQTVMCIYKNVCVADPEECYPPEDSAENPSTEPTPAPTPAPTPGNCKKIYDDCEIYFNSYETYQDIQAAVQNFESDLDIPVWAKKQSNFSGDISVPMEEYSEYNVGSVDIVSCEIETVWTQSKRNECGDRSGYSSGGAILQYLNKSTDEWTDYLVFPEYKIEVDTGDIICQMNYKPISLSIEGNEELFKNPVRMIQKTDDFENPNCKFERSRCTGTNKVDMVFALTSNNTESTPNNTNITCGICEFTSHIFDEYNKDQVLIANAPSCCNECKRQVINDYAYRYLTTSVEDISSKEMNKNSKLEIALHFNYTAVDNCCFECHAFGDPVIVDFNQTKEKWILCDARDENCDFNNDTCQSYGDSCEFSPDYDPENPLFCTEYSRPDRTGECIGEWLEWTVPEFGSPCYPTGVFDMTLYNKTNKDGKTFDVNIFQGSRGIITQMTITHNDEEFIMNAENCSIEIPSGRKATWSYLDKPEIKFNVPDNELFEPDFTKEVLVEFNDNFMDFNATVEVICTAAGIKQGGEITGRSEKRLNIIIRDVDRSIETIEELKKLRKVNGVCVDLLDPKYSVNGLYPDLTHMTLAEPTHKCEATNNLIRKNSYRAMCQDKYATTDSHIKTCIRDVCEQHWCGNHKENKDIIKHCEDKLFFPKDKWNANRFVDRLCEMITINGMENKECNQLFTDYGEKSKYDAITDVFNRYTTRNKGKCANRGAHECPKDPFTIPDGSFEELDYFTSKEGVYLQWCDYEEDESECDYTNNELRNVKFDPWKTFRFLDIAHEPCVLKYKENGFFKVEVEYKKEKDLFQKPLRVIQVAPISMGTGCEPWVGLDAHFTVKAK